MANRTHQPWASDWAVPPGDLLLEALDDRGMTQTELAQRMDRPLKTVNEIIKGKASITAETAIQLERVLGISASYWTGLETLYRDSLARLQAQQSLEEEAEWVDSFPLNDLVGHDLIDRGSSKAETLRNLLAFLGISSPAGLTRLTEAASYRESPAFRASPHAVAAWLRWGELLVEGIVVPKFDRDRFRDVLSDVRPMTRREPFSEILKRVQELCSTAGVIVIVVPELEGTRLSGAARWISGSPVIQLTTRHKTDDQFWFTFFHESGHVLSRARRRDFIDAPAELEKPDETADEEEIEANEFVRDLLIPADDYSVFVQDGNFSRQAVRVFARDQGIAPGIVVGRLQRDKRLGHGQLRELKRSIRLTTS